LKEIISSGTVPVHPEKTWFLSRHRLRIPVVVQVKTRREEEDGPVSLFNDCRNQTLVRNGVQQA